MRVLAIVLACLACTGDGRRVRTTSKGPWGYGGSVGYHRGNSWNADMRGGYGRRGTLELNDYHDDFKYGSGHRDSMNFGGPSGPSGFSNFGDGYASGRVRRGYSEYGRRGNSGYDDMRGGYGRTYGYGRRVRNFRDGYRRGYSEFGGMRGGYGGGTVIELEDDNFKHGTGRTAASELDDYRYGYGRRNFRDGYFSRRARRGRSWFNGARDEYDLDGF